MEEYNAMTFPEGYEKVLKNEMPNMPDDHDIRDGYLQAIMQFLVMM